MAANFKKNLISIFGISCLQLLMVSVAFGHSDNWEAIMASLPVRLVVEDANQNATLYVLKQTHEPLFRKDDGENYSSRLLTEWHRDIASTQYVLCPDIAHYFNTPGDFTPGVFKTYIKNTVKDFDSFARVTPLGYCVTVSFNKSCKNFLDYLTLYEHAPTIKITGKIEDGLGPFKVETLSADMIVLRRKQRVSGGYNSIVLHKYINQYDSNLDNNNMDDFNWMPTSSIPEWVKNKYIHSDEVLLRSTVLVINHPDKTVRQVVYNCMNVLALRHAFISTKSILQDIGNILPLGVTGAVPGNVKQECVLPPDLRRPKTPLIFADLGSDNPLQLRQIMDEFHRTTGIKVEIRACPDAKINEILFTKPRKYNLSILSIDAVRPNPSAFFTGLIADPGVFDFDMPGLTKGYRDLLIADDSDRQNVLVSRLAAELNSEYMVLPLYQGVRRLYYPPDIKNFIIGRNFLAYPEVGDFRW